MSSIFRILQGKRPVIVRVFDELVAFTVPMPGFQRFEESRMTVWTGVWQSLTAGFHQLSVPVETPTAFTNPNLSTA